jgi:superfamily II DNA or RNA helicase
LDYEEGQGLLIVGSSNFSRSAFRVGVEWSLAMSAQAEPYTFQEALDKFMHNFYHECTLSLNHETIANYEKEYRAYHQKLPELVRSITEMEESELMLPQKENAVESVEVIFAVNQAIEPRPAQKNALEALEKTIEEQYDKAMIVMATGLGKTYLAGFFALKFKRILFVAHREEILHQAKKSFQLIMPERSYGLYNGQEKETSADCIFASIYTLGMKKHREAFTRDAFDLIIVDEFHHAAAKSYQSLLDYFEPQFLLGITATPDRMDGKDVYALCDGNIAYQLHFIEAIQRGWLSPFHYYGVYDDTDYSQLTWLGSRYDDEELLAVQLQDGMAQRIYQAWEQHKQTRTLAFCSSILQANFLASYFKQKGIAVLSLHSKTSEMSREEAIHRIQTGGLEVIFTVDLFNEGVDIPSIDTLLFVRPTESLTVFTQQVGRGLRLFGGKSHCTIIDLIGNYRNADLKLSLFNAGTTLTKDNARSFIPEAALGCLIDLEVGIINFLEHLSLKRQPRKDKLRVSYMDLKREIGRRPTYLELHLQGKADSREYKQEFKSYCGFLHWAGELDEQETETFLKHQEWLKEVESTVMTKSYKMVVLLYMLERGSLDWIKPITAADAVPFFHHYLTEKEYRKRIDFSDSETRNLWEYNEAKVSKLIARMPMSKWSGSSKGLVIFEKVQFSLNVNVLPVELELLWQWTKEICLYRLHLHFERRGSV